MARQGGEPALDQPPQRGDIAGHGETIQRLLRRGICGDRGIRRRGGDGGERRTADQQHVGRARVDDLVGKPSGQAPARPEVVVGLHHGEVVQHRIDEQLLDGVGEH